MPLSVGSGRVVENGHHHNHRDREEEEENDVSLSEEEEEEEYELQDIRDRIRSSRGSRFNLIEKELGLASSIRTKFSRENVINGFKDLSKDLVIHPDNKYATLSLSLSLFLFFHFHFLYENRSCVFIIL